jgi:hypothetical protein
LRGLWLWGKWLLECLCPLSWRCWLAAGCCRKAISHVLLLRVVLVQQWLLQLCWHGLLECCWGNGLLCCCCCCRVLLLRCTICSSTCCCTLCPGLGSLGTLLLVAAFLLLACLPVGVREVIPDFILQTQWRDVSAQAVRQGVPGKGLQTQLSKL